MTPTGDLSDTTTMVVGASRGLGRGIAVALADYLLTGSGWRSCPDPPAGGGCR